jgi:TetR/AcrR family transcriptional repressor of uid operon
MASGGLLAMALDPAIATPQDATSERILDAALELAAASGLGNLTMDDVARRASVGRMTVYRRFGDRQALVQALGVRETRRALAEIAAALDPSASVEDRVTDGFVAALGVARTHPLLVRFARFEPEALLDPIRAEDDLFANALREFVSAQIRDGGRSRELSSADAEAAAELLVRIGVSFVLMPRSVIDYENEATARELARKLIAPIVAPTAG